MGAGFTGPRADLRDNKYVVVRYVLEVERMLAQDITMTSMSRLYPLRPATLALELENNDCGESKYTSPHGIPSRRQ